MRRSGLLCLSVLTLTLTLGACTEEDGKKAVGETCSDDAECADGICHHETCVSSSPLANSAACKLDAECKSMHCKVGACAQGVLSGGDLCRNDEECASDACKAGTCEAKPMADSGPPDLGVDDAAPDKGPCVGCDGGPDTATDVIKYDVIKLDTTPTPDTGQPDAAPTPDTSAKPDAPPPDAPPSEAGSADL